MSLDDAFVKDLRDALNHLYAPDYLRRSALARRLGMSTRVDAPVAMQRLLEEAILALKTKGGETAKFHHRKIYELLSLRYLDQYNQKRGCRPTGHQPASVSPRPGGGADLPGATSLGKIPPGRARRADTSATGTTGYISYNGSR